MNFAAANRQPDVFDDPDKFDIHRANAAQHISFGKGIHYCLGANLAKFEAQLVLEALVERVPVAAAGRGPAPDIVPQHHVPWSRTPRGDLGLSIDKNARMDGVRCMVIRGGTSKGAVLPARRPAGRRRPRATSC